MSMGVAALGLEDFHDDRDLYDFVGMGQGMGGGGRGGSSGGSTAPASSRGGHSHNGIALDSGVGVKLSNTSSSSSQQPVVFLTAEDRLRHFMREMQLQQQQQQGKTSTTTVGMGGIGSEGGSSERDRSIAWGDPRSGGGGGGGSSGSKGSGSGSKSSGLATSSPQQKHPTRHNDHEAYHADAKHGVGSPYNDATNNPNNRRSNVGLEEEMMLMPSLSLYDLAAMPLEMTVDMETRYHNPTTQPKPHFHLIRTNSNLILPNTNLLSSYSTFTLFHLDCNKTLI